MLKSAEISLTDRRFGRISVMMLVIAILCASIVYALVSLDTASELRTRNALEQNRSAAQISARLLDEQWQDLLVVTQELEHHPSVEDDLQQRNRKNLSGELKYAVDLVPALMLAAVYTNRGDLISTYPDSPVAPRSAVGTAWFEGVKKHNELFQSDSMRIRLPDQVMTEVIAVAMPLGPKQHPSGCMLEIYRVGDVDRWLLDLGLKGSDLYIVNSRGQIVDASTGADRHMKFANLTSFQLAMHQRSGSRISQHFYSQDDADVGYAYAIRPGWAVLVSRPVSLALAPTRSLVGRLSLLGVVVLALLAIGASLILRLYRTQDSLALAVTRQNAELRATDRMKSDFLANVSHDLRTPLAAVQISISGLLEPELTWEPDEAKESLRVASDSLDQINARVRNLLEMSRIEADVWPVTKQVCDLTDLVGSALERMKLVTVGRELRLNFPERALLLECDPNQMETVIVNLIENATKYSPSGTAIGLVGSERSGRIRLTVDDNGTGIPLEDIDHVFEKFYRSRIHAFFGGTGLGLAICKSIVEAHSGTIEVRNLYKPSTTDPSYNGGNSGIESDVENEPSSSETIGAQVERRTVIGAEFSFSLPAFTGDAQSHDER